MRSICPIRSSSMRSTISRTSPPICATRSGRKLPSWIPDGPCEALKCTHQAVTGRLLIDQMVGTKLRNAGHRQVERLGGSEIDDELKFPWQLDRQVARFFTLEDPPGVDADLMIGLHQSGSIAHQAAALGVFTPRVGRGQLVVFRKRHNLTAASGKERVGADKKRISVLIGGRGECRLNSIRGVGIKDDQPYTSSCGYGLHVLDFKLVNDIAGVYQ